MITRKERKHTAYIAAESIIRNLPTSTDELRVLAEEAKLAFAEVAAGRTIWKPSHAAASARGMRQRLD